VFVEIDKAVTPSKGTDILCTLDVLAAVQFCSLRSNSQVPDGGQCRGACHRARVRATRCSSQWRRKWIRVRDLAAQLRADKLFQLARRGFEQCCSWSRSEVWKHVRTTGDAWRGSVRSDLRRAASNRCVSGARSGRPTSRGRYADVS